MNRTVIQLEIEDLQMGKGFFARLEQFLQKEIDHGIMSNVAVEDPRDGELYYLRKKDDPRT